MCEETVNLVVLITYNFGIGFHLAFQIHFKNNLSPRGDIKETLVQGLLKNCKFLKETRLVFIFLVWLDGLFPS